MSSLDILVIDDDPEVLRQLKQLLPEKVDDHDLHYTWEEDFDHALEKLTARRYDLVVSDIYLGRDTKHKIPGDAENRASDIVDLITKTRACPIILITDGTPPDVYDNKPFVESIDKGKGLHEAIEAAFFNFIGTKIPDIMKNIHDEIDKYAGSFLWGFLEKNWDQLSSDELLGDGGLDRVMRRRAGFQLSHVLEIDGEAAKRDIADPVDYYIMPPIERSIRLGEILRHKEDGSFRVVLTPHCQLTLQQGQEKPRAEYILTLLTSPAGDLLKGKGWDNPDKKLPARCAIPARGVGNSEGRYCFLPGFLDVPDLYCDLMRADSLAYDVVAADWDRIAVLDSPFAEAIQAAYSKFFGAVGLPDINFERLMHLTAG